MAKVTLRFENASKTHRRAGEGVAALKGVSPELSRVYFIGKLRSQADRQEDVV